MAASPQAIGAETTILDLNDHCLREVFECMDIDGLAVVADVCSRFRRNAVQAAHPKFKHLRLDSAFRVGNYYSKLRNFGASIETVVVCPDSNQRTIKLLTSYIGDSIELVLVHAVITNYSSASLIVPLLGRAHTLEFHGKISGIILNNLPRWSPELRELKYQFGSNDDDEFTGLHQKFPKLESIVFREINGVENSDIEKFLKQNPQLKRLDLTSCPDVDDRIFLSITKYVPQIEKIVFYSSNKLNKNNVKYFGKLRELKSLTIDACDDNFHPTHADVCTYFDQAPLVVHEIASAGISLEELRLNKFDLRHDSQQFVDEISSLKQLKTLDLWYVRHMKASHLIRISKALKELSDVSLGGMDLKMTKNDLLSLVQHAEKLREFTYLNRDTVDSTISIDIDVATFKKLVEIVNQRREQTPLTLRLDELFFTAEELPEELTKAASKSLSLDIS